MFDRGVPPIFSDGIAVLAIGQFQESDETPISLRDKDGRRRGHFLLARNTSPNFAMRSSLVIANAQFQAAS